MGAPAFCGDGAWSELATFKLRKLQEAAAAAKFNEHDTEAVQPTLMLDDDKDPDTLKEGIITRIHVRIKDAAADTCILRLWRKNTDGSTKPYELQLDKLYESCVLACDVAYDFTELEIPFKLAEEGKMYYGLQWTTGAAPAGNVQGYIEVSGETVK